MPRPYADLHTHTHCSDGRLSPTALVKRAADRGIRVLAVTDHDTIAGLDHAREAALNAGMGFVPGVELSITVDGHEVHLLAYGFDPTDAGMRRHMRHIVDVRRDRIAQIVQNLNDCGVDVTVDQVEARAAEDDGTAPDEPGYALGRPHVASTLLDLGVVDTMDEAFDRYLSRGRPGFAAKPPVPVDDILDVIHGAGGIAVLAHPGHWTPGERIRRMVGAGLDGIEVYHPSHDASLQNYYRRMARSRSLIPTGGSDFHGHEDQDDDRLGAVGLPGIAWERMTGSLTYYDAA